MEQGLNNMSNASTSEPVSRVNSPTVSNPSIKDDVVFTNKPKKNKGMILGMVLFGLLAVGGIGFGVWTMMDGNAQKEALNSQISALREQNSELTGKMGNDTENVEDEIIEDVNVEANDVDVAGYIYIGEWGIKIKIPESLKNNIGYIYSSSEIQILDSGESHTYYGSQIDYTKNSILSISRSKAGTTDFEGCRTSCPTYITTIDGFDYSYMLSNGNLDLDTTQLQEMTKKEAFSEF